MKMINAVSELPYPRKFKATLSSLHASVVDYAVAHYDGTKAFQRKIIRLMNSISYHVISGDTLPDSIINNTGDFSGVTIVDDNDAEETIGDLFISAPNVDWSGFDIIRSDDPETTPEINNEVQRKNISVITTNPIQSNIGDPPTPATHLYLIAPKIPRFDVDHDPWYRTVSHGKVCEIYKSLPLIPKRQVDITVTTDPGLMNEIELMSLYPNHTVKTRADVMYQPVDGIKLDPEVGLILPIKGFTERQVLDNIIKYPHIFRLKRIVNDEQVSFYQHIEINGELLPVEDVIDTLPEFKKIPKTPEFIKEYVVRRYLLERDLRKVDHKYPVYGTLDPFLTLFTTPGIYTKYGYTNHAEMARSCVKCRVSYLQSRNPFIRSQLQPGTCIFAHRCQEPVCNCNGACPIHGETSYLMERNGIPMTSAVFGASDKQLETAVSLIRSKNRVEVYESQKTIEASYIIAYSAICDNWKGNAFHCCVYRLDYSKYLDDLKKSWGLKDTPDDLEYQQIWMQTSKILIITNLDYLNFKDFEAQTLLNLVHTRRSNGLKTIIVSPKISSLIGSGAFYKRMQEYFREAVTVR